MPQSNQGGSHPLKANRNRTSSSPAVTTLLKILVDPAAALAVKARCAYYILDQARKAVETEEIEARVSDLERAAGTQKP